MALAMGPRILLLDKPTAGLSMDGTLATANLLKGLAGRVTVIVIEHDMGFVRDLGARTVVPHHGQIIAQGPFSDIEEDDTVRDIYLGRR
jgi:branched-chain amino acid transport system ATP-binding protein